MPKFYMMIGPAGCGKSYMAEAMAAEANSKGKDAVVVSSDAVRKELYGDEAVQKDHEKVFSICHARIESAIRGGHHVIFDATNLNPGHRMSAIRSAKRSGCGTVYGLVYTGNLETCLARNAARDRRVPDDAIVTMYKLLVRNEPRLSEGFDALISMNAMEVYKKKEMEWKNA